MAKHEYAIKILNEKLAELEDKKCDDIDINNGLESLMQQLKSTIQELENPNY